MKYRSISFFTKYGIEPDVDIGKLRVLFQIDPNKRKDLPVVNKIISSSQLLFEEELYTPHSDEDRFLQTHARVLNEIAELKNDCNIDTVHDLKEDFVYLCVSPEDWDHFFYYYDLNDDDKSESTVQEFIVCIFDEIKHILTNSIGDVSIPTTTALYDLLDDVADTVDWLDDKREELDDDLCEYADNSLSIGDASESFEAKFACLLTLAAKTKHDYFKSSLSYVIDKMVDDIDTYGNVLLNQYKLITAVFSGKDLLKISSFITKAAHKYCDFTGSSLELLPEDVEEKSTKIVSAVGILEKADVKLENVEDGKNKFDVDEIKIYTQIASFLSRAGADWYDNYRDLINDMEQDCTPENMYDLVSHFISAKPNSKLKSIFTNVVLEKSDFKPLLDFILEGHTEISEKKTTRPVSPNEIDNFIAKYYWIIYTLDDDDTFTETMFNNIRMFSCDVLCKAETAMNFLNASKNSFDKNLKIQAAELAKITMTKVLSEIPKDFFVDENLRAVDAVKNFGGTHTGSVSKSSLYIDKYCDLFGMKRTKYGRRAYENRSSVSATNRYSSSSSSSSSSGCCYVATAVYGSYDCPEVWTLRRFRDFELAETWYGRAFVLLYYAISPTIVKWFGHTEWFKKIWRSKLDSMVRKLQKRGYKSTPYEDRNW